MSCEVVAVALIRPLAREPPYAPSAALKKQKKKNMCFLSFKFLSFESVPIFYRCKRKLIPPNILFLSLPPRLPLEDKAVKIVPLGQPTLLIPNGLGPPCQVAG